MFCHGANSNPCRRLLRKSINAGTDGRKRNRSRFVLSRQFHATPIAAGEQFIFAAASTLPHRADGMKDPFCRQSETWSCFGIAGRAPAKFFASRKQFGTGGAMDGAIYPPASQKRRIRGIHDRVNFKLGNVPFNRNQS
jgi:hypothetical protein